MGFISSLLCCSTSKPVENKKGSTSGVMPSVSRKKAYAGNKNRACRKSRSQGSCKQASGYSAISGSGRPISSGDLQPEAREFASPLSRGRDTVSLLKKAWLLDDDSTVITSSVARCTTSCRRRSASDADLDKILEAEDLTCALRSRGGKETLYGEGEPDINQMDGNSEELVSYGQYLENGNEEENDLEDGDASSGKETFFGDKQTVTVYQGETDTSTGTTDNDKHDGMSNSIHEVTTIVNDAENSSSGDDSNLITQHTQVLPEEQQQRLSNNSHAYDLDVEIVTGAEYEEDVILDLSALQPEQAHAPGFRTLLPPQFPQFYRRKCLVLDLDETLVHSSFKYLHTADFVIPVEIDNQVHNVYVIKRPGVDEFLRRVGELYEVVVFTASVSRYGDPLLDILDKHNVVHHRLFRDSCYNYEGNYIKNLSQIGRPLSDLIILDNSPASYIFHPHHAIPISSWFSDAHDNELLDILPLLEDLASDKVPDVGRILDVTI
ncbi:HAD family hydrolase Ecym_7104 [Eremothecium cymbalariae DBVPG|uniref:FCP1 homology domain-containing protein n=1 Tax=Eremothecium cymbalariae (strain CBS 270.75 / DBVPG 7215 / KCTC 17166 / NRRL Y-17582) TaxID=931890 RepID=G8JVU1_ERECY|nr:hypothetical protein Ecym_7104 [Eremothecium cymbalariae DBVPG\